MVSVFALWLPILVSAALAFLGSMAIHMFLGYHKHDFTGVPDEDGTMDALRSLEIPAGNYAIPYAGSMEVHNSEEFREKARRGPLAFLTVVPPGTDPFSMGKQFAQWFVFCAVVSLFAGYVATLSLGPGAEYLQVFRVVSATAFAGYWLANVPQSIWYSQKWGTAGRNALDALIYSLLAGGTFGWLWPS